MPEVNDFNRGVIEEYRATGGKVTGAFAGAPLLLLTTTGAKSGQTRTNPVVYTKDGDRIVIVASKAGAPTNPDWYHNLVAHPLATVEVGDERFDVRAVVAEGDERERLFRKHAEQMPTFADYETKTTRQLPVVVLERVTPTS